MTNHPNRAAAIGMTHAAYKSYARDLRHYADLIEANCVQMTPQKRRTLTQAINNVAQMVRRMRERHIDACRKKAPMPTSVQPYPLLPDSLAEAIDHYIDSHE